MFTVQPATQAVRLYSDHPSRPARRWTFELFENWKSGSSAGRNTAETLPELSETQYLIVFHLYLNVFHPYLIVFRPYLTVFQMYLTVFRLYFMRIWSYFVCIWPYFGTKSAPWLGGLVARWHRGTTKNPILYMLQPPPLLAHPLSVSEVRLFCRHGSIIIHASCGVRRNFFRWAVHTSFDCTQR